MQYQYVTFWQEHILHGKYAGIRQLTPSNSWRTLVYDKGIK